MTEIAKKEIAWEGNNHFCQNPTCPNDHVIKVTAHRGGGFCSIDCKKALGRDLPSTGTMMFVTSDERKKILKARHG